MSAVCLPMWACWADEPWQPRRNPTHLGCTTCSDAPVDVDALRHDSAIVGGPAATVHQALIARAPRDHGMAPPRGWTACKYISRTHLSHWTAGLCQTDGATLATAEKDVHPNPTGLILARRPIHCSGRSVCGAKTTGITSQTPMSGRYQRFPLLQHRGGTCLEAERACWARHGRLDGCHCWGQAEARVAGAAAAA